MADIALQFNKPIIANQAMNANIPGILIDLSNTLGWCVDAEWTGAPVGNIIISGGNNPLNLHQISSTAAGGTVGSLLSNNDGIHYNYLMVQYNFTSGSGNLNVWVSGKTYV